MEEKIVRIVNVMAEYLNIEQLKKLQEVIVQELSENEPQRENISNDEYITRFLNAKQMEGCSDRTIQYYRVTIEHFLTDINISVRKISTEQIRDYLVRYQKINNCSKVTIDNVRRNISSFFSWLEEEDYILKSPMRRIHKIKTKTVVKETISDEAIEKLRDHCTELRDLAILDLLYSTGIRVGELVNLDISDLDLEQRECIVFGKGDKERKVYFDAKAKIHLQRYLDSRSDNNTALFVTLEKYISLKTGVRHNTEAGYKTVINILKKDPFGSRRIDKVKLSDAKAWLIKLQQKDGKGYSSIHSIRGVLRPAFQMAENDDLIRKNPFQFELASVVVNDSVTREAITRKEERDFLKFIQEDKHFCRYYEGIYILFHTGLRISEFCGLTISDIDFINKRIRVNHQLQRTSKMQYVIEEPKTESGERYIPMTLDVEKCFLHIIENRIAPKVEPMVDGYTGFLYLDKNDMPMVALHWEKYFQHIREKYNSIYKIQMPTITPHVCRHTFCSNMAKSGMNPKTLQYIMGHSDISVTLNTYTHVKFEDAQSELKRVAGE